MADFTYMGTKRAIAKTVSEACSIGSDGPLLELFSGLSAVGLASGTRRKLWFNDVQKFSNLYCEVIFTSQGNVGGVLENWGSFGSLYDRHMQFLEGVFGGYENAETAVWAKGDWEEIRKWEEDTFPQIYALGGKLSRTELHHLFSTTYSLGYFGLAQALQADSVRWAIDEMRKREEISESSHRFAVLAFCRSISNASNSTGHFAQYLTPNEKNLNRIRQKREVSVPAAFEEALRQLRPVGTQRWRATNHVFNDDAVALTSKWPLIDETPKVVYADPPYTDDQYSRYYHVLETAILYDYPQISGKGRYRSGRFSSDFSLASKVKFAFEELVRNAADLGSALVISYPGKGLLPDSVEVIPDLLSKHFSKVKKPTSLAHQHSTMGASKGPHKHDVDEWLFVGQH